MAVIKQTYYEYGSGPNYFKGLYDSYSEERSVTVRRAKPLGVQLLFNGTSVSSRKISYTRDTIQYPISPTAFRKVLLFARSSPTAPIHKDDVTRLRSQIKGQVLNLGQFMGEFVSTVDLVKDAAMRVLRARRALSRLDFRSVYSALSGKENGMLPPTLVSRLKSSTDMVSSNLLAWNYGVRPLLSDLNGALMEMHQVYLSRPFIFSVNAYDRATTHKSGVIMNDSAFEGPGHSYNYDSHDSFRVSTATVELGKHTWTKSASRLGFMNLAALAWELIPYSMVVDQFISIGDYLNNLDSLHGVERIAVNRSYKSKIVQTTFFQGVSGTTSGKAMYESKDSRRTFDTTLPLAYPQWRQGLSFRNILNDLALLRKAPQWRALERRLSV